MNIWECSDGKACSLKASDAEKTIYDIKKQHIRVIDHNLIIILHLNIILIRKHILLTELSIIKTKQKQPKRKKKQIKNNIKVQDVHVDSC